MRVRSGPGWAGAASVGAGSIWEAGLTGVGPVRKADLAGGRRVGPDWGTASSSLALLVKVTIR
ncbi:MAG: hypothetical protein LBJ62_10915 [Bifidobacteriaceae bacterium]|nr:hypothetical protein [Bifidobacteriaceae bacterium]